MDNLDENTFEFILGFALLTMLFLGFYGLTRVIAWLNRFLESRK